LQAHHTTQKLGEKGVVCVTDGEDFALRFIERGEIGEARVFSRFAGPRRAQFGELVDDLVQVRPGNVHLIERLHRRQARRASSFAAAMSLSG
ncbi:MAG: hypothetical protein AAFR01_05170, partial [Pseudomonadota bacterium]